MPSCSRLLDDAKVGVDRAGGGGDRLRRVAGDEDGALGLERARRGQRMRDQRRAGQRMQDLGQVRVHPRAHAGGEHDDGDWHAAEPSLAFGVARF